MAVKRISNINIGKNTSLFTAIYGNIANGEFFIDADLKAYTLHQQLYLYLKSEGYIVLFYEQASEFNIHSFSKDDVRTFLYDFKPQKIQATKYVARHINSPFKSPSLLFRKPLHKPWLPPCPRCKIDLLSRQTIRVLMPVS